MIQTIAGPITVILNGSGDSNKKAQLAASITEAFVSQNTKCDIIPISDNFEVAICETAKRGGIVVAAGGDGTVNAAAALCYKHGATLGIIPLGTFNYFARSHGIPLDISEAVKVILAGHSTTTRAGFVQEHIFLNNASFGVYTQLIREREKTSSWLGRLRIVALFSAAYTLLNNRKLLSVWLNVGNARQRYKTLLTFIGNNAFQLENLGIDVADCVKQNTLAVMVMKPSSPMQRLWLILRGISRTLKDEEKLNTFCADSLTAEFKQKYVEVVIDGEIIGCPTPLEFRIEPEALRLLAPPAEAVA